MESEHVKSEASYGEYPHGENEGFLWFINSGICNMYRQT